MATVYLAEDLKHHRKVAVKVLRPELAAILGAERFLKEIDVTANLQHPHILPLFDSGEADSFLYYVMPLVEGESLRDKLNREKQLSVQESVEITKAVASALDYAHRHKVLHRDIKPENILLHEGQAMVADFGIALAVSEAGGERLTATGLTLGTPAYMSPEQASADRELDGRSDIYSLASVVYEMLAGEPPFGGASVQAILAKRFVDPVPHVRRLRETVAPPVDHAICKALAKAPADRFATGADFVEALSSVEPGQHAATDSRAGVTAGRSSIADAPPALGTLRFAVKPHTVGRKPALAALQEAFEATQREAGQLLCVTGEAGMGKTTLVENFLGELVASGRPVMIGRGRCSERLAGTEAYLPVLEALDTLMESEAGDSIAEMMRARAPSWYAQLKPGDEATGAPAASSQERMKREFTVLLTELSFRQPTILFFDDVHWADASTVDLLAYVGSRFASARTLIVVTYRSEELRLTDHPFLGLKLDLEARGVCREIRLEFLSRDDIAKYIEFEYPNHRFPDELPTLIHGRTEGSPLIMVDLLRYLQSQDVIARDNGSWKLARALTEIEEGLPQSVHSMIEKKIDRLAPEARRLLAVASVQGSEFHSAVLADVLSIDPVEVEETLQEMDRVHRLIRPVGEEEFPDRTFTGCYRFVHVLYQNALYDGLTPARRVSWSKAVGESLLGHFGEACTPVAAQLAFLFEAGRDFERACDYFRLAAEHAVSVYAYKETVALARRGLAQLDNLPETRARAARELALCMLLGSGLAPAEGFGSRELEETYTRARELALAGGEARPIFQALSGLWVFYIQRNDLKVTLSLGEECLAIADGDGDRELQLHAHTQLGVTRFWRGELGSAVSHMERGRALNVALKDGPLRWLGLDPEVNILADWAVALWVSGYAEQAMEKLRQTRAAAEKAGDPLNDSIALFWTAWMHQLRREPGATLEGAELSRRHCAEYDIAEFLATSTFAKGWALAAETDFDSAQAEGRAGFELMREGLDALRATGTEIFRPHYLGLFAEACGRAGQSQEGLAAIDQALQEAPDDCDGFYGSDLLRIKGDLLLAREEPVKEEAVTCFQQAIEVARRQEAKTYELRALMSWARVLHKQGEKAQAREMLRELYGRFTEGLDTPDLVEARAFLDELDR